VDGLLRIKGAILVSTGALEGVAASRGAGGLV